jgi:hypothetical protein
MADNINNINNCDDDDDKRVTLPIDITRLKEIKAMEDAEQRLIEDLFSTQANTHVIQVKQKNPTLPNQKKPKKKPK